jgi:methylglutaconyl-CoA hydratase
MRIMNELVLSRRQGPVLVLTLNDPKRANPLSAPLVCSLLEAIEAAAKDSDLRAVIITGAGRNFSAGADLAALERIAAGGDGEAGREDSHRLERLFAAVLDHPKLTVAAVNGAAVAGGCGLATACDVVIAESTARLCYSEVKIGFVPALVSTFLTRRVSGHVARRLLLDPEMLDASVAESFGLVDEIVPEGEAVDHAVVRALAIARKTSPAAIAATKALLNETVGMGWRDSLARAAAVNAGQRMHPECLHGVRRFLATKTTPDWLEDEP